MYKYNTKLVTYTDTKLWHLHKAFQKVDALLCAARSTFMKSTLEWVTGKNQKLTFHEIRDILQLWN